MIKQQALDILDEIEKNKWTYDSYSNDEYMRGIHEWYSNALEEVTECIQSLPDNEWNGWIPTHEIPPKMYDTVLIWYHNWESYTSVYLWVWIFENQMWDRYDVPDFWQPLPNPPTI